MSKRMFEPGDYITSLSELSEQEFVFHRKKILNRGWFMSWQLQYAETQIKWQYVRKAKRLTTQKAMLNDDVERTGCRELVQSRW